MKSKLLFGALLGSIALASCTADEDMASVAKQESPIKFAVTMETADGALTKAEMTSSMKLNFTTGDLMSLYHGISAPTTAFTGYQNAVYEGTAADGEALVFTTKSMVLPGGAIMVYPCDTTFANNGASAPVVKIAANQNAKSKELLPFASEILTIGAYDEEEAQGTAGYGKYYPIVLKQIGSTLKLVTKPSNTEVINSLPVAPLKVSSVEMTAKTDADDAAFNTAVALTAENETPVSNDTYAIWTNVSGVNTATATGTAETLTTKDITDNFTAVFSLLPTAEDIALAAGASVKINTNYGYVELNDAAEKVWNVAKNSSETTAETVKEGIESVLQKTWIANTTSTNFNGEKTGGNFNRTIEADMKDLNMDGLHIKDAQHLIDALMVYDAIKESQADNITFYLDGDKNNNGVFTMTPEAAAAYAEHLDMTSKAIVFTPCTTPNEECTAVKFTCTEETEVPANIQFGTSVTTQLEGTWKYSDNDKKFANVKTLDVLEGSTLNMSNVVGSNLGIYINNYGQANVSGTTYLRRMRMQNFGEMNIAEGAELRVETTFTNGSQALDNCGKISNFGVLATVDGFTATITNLGYIKQETETSKTYITSNQTNSANFANAYRRGSNVLGIIELFDKDDDNYSVSNDQNQGFIMITTTAASVKADDFGKEANYVKIAGDCTALDFTPNDAGRVKFIEIASTKEVVWSANAEGGALTGLIMETGTKMNLKKDNTLKVTTAFLKGTIYQGGALTISSYRGYLGGAATDQRNIVKY